MGRSARRGSGGNGGVLVGFVWVFRQTRIRRRVFGMLLLEYIIPNVAFFSFLFSSLLFFSLLFSSFLFLLLVRLLASRRDGRMQSVLREGEKEEAQLFDWLTK